MRHHRFGIMAAILIAPLAARGAEINVKITWEKEAVAYAVDGKAVAEAELTNTLKAAKPDKDTQLIVTADKDAPYRAFFQVLVASSTAGVPSLKMALAGRDAIVPKPPGAPGTQQAVPKVKEIRIRGATGKVVISETEVEAALAADDGTVVLVRAGLGVPYEEVFNICAKLVTKKPDRLIGFGTVR